MKLQDAHIKYLGIYIFLTIAIAIVFRVIISALKVLEYAYMPKPEKEVIDFNDLNKFKRFRLIFWGVKKKDPFPDFWYNTFLGILELIAFPIFMKTEQYGMIGAWIGFNSVAQWNAWNKNRYVFNRFLIAHALILFICFLWLTKFVSIKT